MSSTPPSSAGSNAKPEHVAAMRQALELARAHPGGDVWDVPVGALVLDASGDVVAAARNEKELLGDPTAHAEVLVIRQAAERLGNRVLDGCTLVVTLEPCVMCAGAIQAARVSTVVFGAWDEKAGAAGSMYDVLRDRRLLHRPEVIGGVLEDECAQLLREFFEARR